MRLGLRRIILNVDDHKLICGCNGARLHPPLCQDGHLVFWSGFTPHTQYRLDLESGVLSSVTDESTTATILTITVTTSPPLRSPELGDAATVVRRLLNNGYDEIDLAGLEPFGAKLRDGQICDTTPLRIDDDAEFLVEGYHALARCIASGKHWVYLADGCFEITAQIRGDDVRMRIGEYRTPFEFDSQDGVMISLREYTAFWDSIAMALLLGSSSPLLKPQAKRDAA